MQTKLKENMKLHSTSLTAAQCCQDAIYEFKRKSDHNKKETMLCFIVSMAGTLAVPLFLTLGDGMANQLSVSPFFLSKLVPSIFSLAAAFSTAWLQLRKPQHLWSLYRTAQRELEEHHRAFQFGLNDFANASNSDKLLAEYISAVYKKTHASWVPLVPSPEQLPRSEENEIKN